MADLTWRTDALHRFVGLLDEAGLLSELADPNGKTINDLIRVTVGELMIAELNAAIGADNNDANPATLAAAIDAGYKPGEFDHPNPVHEVTVRTLTGLDGMCVECSRCGNLGWFRSGKAASKYARHHSDTVAVTEQAVNR